MIVPLHEQVCRSEYSSTQGLHVDDADDHEENPMMMMITCAGAVADTDAHPCH